MAKKGNFYIQHFQYQKILFSLDEKFLIHKLFQMISLISRVIFELLDFFYWKIPSSPYLLE